MQLELRTQLNIKITQKKMLLKSKTKYKTYIHRYIYDKLNSEAWRSESLRSGWLHGCVEKNFQHPR